MIIEKLIEYSGGIGKNGRSDPAFRNKPVKYLITVDANGRCTGISTTQGKQRQSRKGIKYDPKEYEIPLFESPGSTILATPLVGTTSYIFGDGEWSDNKDRARHRQHHQAFLDTLQEIVSREPKVQRVFTFYSAPLPDLTTLKLKSGDRLAFVFAEDPDVLACELDSIQRFWSEKFAQYVSGKQKGSNQCLACGETRPSAETHAFITGIPTDGLTKRFKLISFDAGAFCSHGLKKSLNAPMCQTCVDAYAHSLNRLLSGRSTHYRDNDSNIVYAFWSREPVEFDLNATFVEADVDAVKNLYESLNRPSQSGGISEEEASEFYVLALSASGARAVVRNWIETHLPSTKRNIAKWFDDLTIALDRPWPNQSEPRASPPDHFGKFPLKVLCRTVGRKKQIGWEVPVDLSSQLFRAGLTGMALPDSVLAAALRRVRADQDIPPPRAALIKLVLNRLSQSPNKGENEMSETLDTNKPDIAYVCGRLLAVLERIQGRALGNINASVIDRYYGAASTAPRPIFPRLMANAQNHLGKLRGERPGEATNLQKDMETVVDKIGDREAWIGDLPEWLDLEAQGRFAIGFYHQRADYRARGKKTTPDESGANSDSANDTSHELKGEDHAS
jgi:CRISPR-associated protein Csd1